MHEYYYYFLNQAKNQTITGIDTDDDCHCGSFGVSKIVNNECHCTCLDHFIGSPPDCQPECLVNSDCPAHQSCQAMNCINPCQDACGINSDCKVIKHRAFCACKEGHTGDPYFKCSRNYNPNDDDGDDDFGDDDDDDYDPCRNSPCGQFSSCIVVDDVKNGNFRCECLPGHIGQPPLCHPECKSNYDCSPTHACINDRCEPPCQGACGLNADCQIVNHSPRCSCPESYVGDAYETCFADQKPPLPPPNNNKDDDIYKNNTKAKEDEPNPCLSCGPNSQCEIQYQENGIAKASCVCFPNYVGDPLTGCRPECLLNTDCAKTEACVNGKCVDPCPNTCGLNAICTIKNHFTVCECEAGFTGDAFKSCSPISCNNRFS